MLTVYSIFIEMCAQASVSSVPLLVERRAVPQLIMMCPCRLMTSVSQIYLSK